MIKVRYENLGNKVMSYTIDRKTYIRFLSCVSIQNYEIDIPHHIIYANALYQEHIFRSYGVYDKIYLKALSNIVAHYEEDNDNHYGMPIYPNFLGNEKVPAKFFDEIHFVGLLYVEHIKATSPSRMVKPPLIDSLLVEEERHYSFKDYPSELLQLRYLDYEIESIQVFKGSDQLSAFDKDKKTVYICPEYIDSLQKELRARDSWYLLNIKKFTEFLIYNGLAKSVFKYKAAPHYPIVEEARASYFASYMTNGVLDTHIAELCKFQDRHYRFPFLSFAYQIYQLKGDKSTVPYESLLNSYYQTLAFFYGFGEPYK